MAKIFGLADCNNFFVSCERAFRPDLARRPVVVLSNNDGCVISRSQEVKALGIPMGAPRFKIENEIRNHSIAVFSSNFALYGNMSNRVMRTLAMFCPDIEQYSIDEAFFNAGTVPVIRDHLTEAGRQIRAYILKTTGIPVSIGFAPSKTLANMANYYVKKHPDTGGVLDLTSRKLQQEILYRCPLEDVWGIGRQLSVKLAQLNIRTPAELAAADFGFIGRRLGVNVQKTVMELNGISCYEFSEDPAPRKSIMHSATMSSPSTIFNDVSEAVCSHVAIAAESMRREGQRASCLTLFFRTGAYQTDGQFYAANGTRAFDSPVNDTRVLTAAALDLLKQYWHQGSRISKIGVILSQFTADSQAQLSLFSDPQKDERSARLMEVMDRINSRTRNGVFFLGQGLKDSWRGSRQRCSPRYTTSWDEVIRVK